MKKLELTIREIDDLLEHLFRRLRGKTEGLSLLEPAIVLLQNLKDSNPAAYELNLRRFTPVIIDAFISRAYISFGYDGLEALLATAPDISMISGDYTPAGVQAGLEEARSRMNDIQSVLEGDSPGHAETDAESSTEIPERESIFREHVRESAFLPLVSVFNAGKSPITLGRIVQPHVELTITGEWSMRKKSPPTVTFDHMFAEPGSEFEKQINTALEVAERFAVSRLGIRDIVRMPREYRLSLPEAAITSSSLPGTMSGGSAGLSFTMLFISLLCKLDLSAKKFNLRPGMAVTGIIDSSGRVLPVEPLYIGEKIKAAFYSTCDGIVLPAENYESGVGELKSLKKKHPSRKFKLVPASNIDDSLAEKEIFRGGRTPFYRSFFQRSFHRRKHLLAGTSFVALLLLFSFLFPRFTDTKIAQVKLVDSILVLTNQYGATVTMHNIGFLNPYPTSRASCQVFIRDFNGDGKNSIFCLVTEGSDSKISLLAARKQLHYYIFSENGKLIEEDVLVDEDVLGDQMPEFSKTKRILLSLFYDIYFDGEGIGHILFLTHRRHHPPTILYKFSMDDYSYEMFIHKGYLQELMLKDFDGNGVKDCMLVGYNYEFDSSVIAVLDPKHIRGSSPRSNAYSIPGNMEDNAKYYITLPHFRKYKYLPKPQFALSTKISKESDSLSILVNSRAEDVLFVFDKEYRCTRATVLAGSAGGNRKKKDMLIIADYEGKAEDEKELRRGVRYWNGKAWQSEATINQSYLKMISSKDSTTVDHADKK